MPISPIDITDPDVTIEDIVASANLMINEINILTSNTELLGMVYELQDTKAANSYVISVRTELIDLANTKLNISTFNSQYTAANILTRLLTVDGGASGLDSQYLNGNDSEFYRNASNLNAGTVPSPRLSGSYTNITNITGLTNLSAANGTITTISSNAITANTVTATTYIGITKAMAGLANVDNTSDADKPVSTATQNALNLKSNILNPVFNTTLTVSGNTAASIDIRANTGQPSYLNMVANGRAGYDYRFVTSTAAASELAIVGNDAQSKLTLKQTGALWTAELGDIATLFGTKANLSGADFSGVLKSGPIASAMTSANTTGSVVIRNNGGTGDTNMAMLAFECNGYYTRKLGLRADGYLGIGGGNGAAWTWFTDASGNMTAAGNVTAYSDERLKSNIRPIENARDLVSKLNGKRYVKDGVEGIGVIAQEVQRILPELVLEGPDENKTLSVSYGQFAGVFIEAIKELDEDLRNTKNELETVKAELADLRALVLSKLG